MFDFGRLSINVECDFFPVCNGYQLNYSTLSDWIEWCRCWLVETVISFMLMMILMISIEWNGVYCLCIDITAESVNGAQHFAAIAVKCVSFLSSSFSFSISWIQSSLNTNSSGKFRNFLDDLSIALNRCSIVWWVKFVVAVCTAEIFCFARVSNEEKNKQYRKWQTRQGRKLYNRIFAE